VAFEENQAGNSKGEPIDLIIGFQECQICEPLEDRRDAEAALVSSPIEL
jgi:hypothetical protein